MSIQRSPPIGLLISSAIIMSGLGVLARAQDREPYDNGKATYERICQACHMPDAKGAVGAGAYPALAGNGNLANPLYPALVVLRGLKSMPSFSDLDDRQVADVVNYIRTSFGNEYADRVTTQQVKSLRPGARQPKGGRAG